MASPRSEKHKRPASFLSPSITSIHESIQSILNRISPSTNITKHVNDVKTIELKDNNNASLPVDRSAFVKRLQSYSPSLWFGKPLLLSPANVSRYGWKCIQLDLLQCEYCEATLCVKIPLDCDEVTTQETAKIYEKYLTSGHLSFCSYNIPNNISPVQFVKLSFQSDLMLEYELNQRIQGLKSLNVLPGPFNHFDIKFQREWNELLTVLKLRDDVTQFNDELANTEFVLAVCGWNKPVENKEEPIQLDCYHCGQTIIIDEFQHYNTNSNSSHEILETRDNIEEENQRQKRVKLSLEAFHPLMEHRYFCAFVTLENNELAIPEIQSSSKTLNRKKLLGWQRILEAYQNQQAQYAEIHSNPASLSESLLSHTHKLALLSE